MHLAPPLSKINPISRALRYGALTGFSSIGMAQGIWLVLLWFGSVKLRGAVARYHGFWLK